MKRWMQENPGDTIASTLLFFAVIGLLFVCLYAIGGPVE